jgi:predicted ATPase
MAKKEKFIEEVQPGSYQWLHDKIQEAAFYSLDGLGESLKFDSGLALMNGLSRDELDSHLFVVANLLGDATPRNDVQALAVATLFLQASEKAVSVSAFTSAARFSIRGISCLPESRWTSCQDVTLRLYSIATKSCGYLGQDKKMWELGNIVINQHNCSVLDKLSVYSSHIDFLGNTGKPFAAVDVALKVLKQLGCSFPKNGFLQAIKVFSKLNKMKKDPPTAESLRLLPIMTDPRKMAIAEIVFHLEPYFYYTKQMFLHALCGIKRVELLREGGVCDFTADAFFVVGVVIAALSGNDENTLVRWSELARAMTKIVPSGQHESRAMYSTTLALSWRRPIPSLIKDFDKGYESGMKSGDTEG